MVRLLRYLLTLSSLCSGCTMADYIDSGTVPIVPVTPDATSLASASAGTVGGAASFSTANYFSVQGVGVDMTPGNSIGVLFELRSLPSEQVPIGYCDATHGWYVDITALGDIRVLFKGGTALPTAGTVYPGVHALVFTRQAGGALHVSLDGGAAIELSAAPTYVAAIGTTDNTIGKVSATVGVFSLLGGSVLEVIGFNQAFTDSELQNASGSVNNTNRYQFDATTLAHAGLVFQWKVDRDYNPASGTSTAGAGSAPITWVKNGLIGKNTIEAENLYTKKFGNLWDAYLNIATTSSSGVAYNLNEAFSRSIFKTQANKLVVDAINDTTIGAIANLDNTGLFVGSNFFNDGAEVLPVNGIKRTSDYYDLPQNADQTLTVLEGIQSCVTLGGVRRAITVLGFRVPVSTPILSITPPGIPNKRVVVKGDSISIGQAVDVGPHKNPGFQCWNMLMRANGSGVFGLINNSYGVGTYHDLCFNAGAITAAVTQLVSECDGLSSNMLEFTLGTNDYGLNAWVSVAAFQTALGNLMDAIHTALPSALVMVMTPLTRLNETTNNASGWNLPQLRTAINTVASSRAWMIVADGTTFVTFPANFEAAGLHPNTAGQAQFEASSRAFINATPALASFAY